MRPHLGDHTGGTSDYQTTFIISKCPVQGFWKDGSLNLGLGGRLPWVVNSFREDYSSSHACTWRVLRAEWTPHTCFPGPGCDLWQVRATAVSSLTVLPLLWVLHCLDHLRARGGRTLTHFRYNRL